VLFRGTSGRWAWLALLALSAAAGWHFGRSFRGQESGGTTSTAGPRNTSVRSSRVGFQPGSPEALWMGKVKKAVPGDFPVLLEQWETVFHMEENDLEGRPENALRWLLGMWLMKDSEGFLKTAGVPEFSYSHWAAQVFVRMMPEKATGLLFGPTHGDLDPVFVDSGTTELAERYPALYLKMNPDGTFESTLNMSDENWETAVANLAKTDALAAANACMKLKEKEHSSKFAHAMLAVASVWGPGDPSMAEWVKGIADPTLRDVATHARLCALSEKDPRAALAEFSSLGLAESHDLPLDAPSQILARMAKADPAEALRIVKDTEALFLKYKRGAFDPLSAEEKAENPFSALGPQSNDDLENNRVRDAVLESLADDLPDDPASLFQALRKLRADGAAGDLAWQRGAEADLIRWKCWEWSPDECLTVANLWENESQGHERSRDDSLWLILASRATAVNPERILGAFDQLPESARAVFASKIIQTLAEKTPDRTMPLLSQLGAKQWNRDLGGALGRNPVAYADAIASLPAETTVNARGAFMEEWGQLDPEAAARWLTSLPDDAASKPAAGGLASAWVRYDSYAVSSWAASLPAGPSRDAAAASLSDSLAKNHPDESWEWANSISDPKARQEALITLDYRWQYDAPPEFRAALDQARRAQGMPERGPKPPPDPNDPFSR